MFTTTHKFSSVAHLSDDVQCTRKIPLINRIHTFTEIKQTQTQIAMALLFWWAFGSRSQCARCVLYFSCRHTHMMFNYDMMWGGRVENGFGVVVFFLSFLSALVSTSSVHCIFHFCSCDLSHNKMAQYTLIYIKYVLRIYEKYLTIIQTVAIEDNWEMSR